jgi:hypothetical protein
MEHQLPGFHSTALETQDWDSLSMLRFTDKMVVREGRLLVSTCCDGILVLFGEKMLLACLA